MHQFRSWIQLWYGMNINRRSLFSDQGEHQGKLLAFGLKKYCEIYVYS